MRSAVFRLIAIAVTIGFSLSPSALGQTTILGVLEESLGHYYGDPSFRSVRIVFQKNGQDWQAFQSDCPDRDCGNAVPPNYPKQIEWTIAFDGKDLGTVISRAAKGNRQYSRGQQEIISTGPIPTVGHRTAEFVDASVYRPLIADSQPYFRDPENWKPFVLPQGMLEALRAEFRKKFPKLCHPSKADESKLEPFPYRDDEVKLVKAYSSRTGWVVARMHLEAIDCNDIEAGFDIDDPWFAVGPEHSMSFLGSGLQLVDAGDYDDDGTSELVFAIYRDDRGGYELFYDCFKKHAVFEFGYH